MKLPSERYDGPTQYDVAGNHARLMAAWEVHPFRTEAKCNEHNDALIVGILKPLISNVQPSPQFIQAMGNMLYGLYHHEGLYEPDSPGEYEADLRRKDALYATHTERLALADRTVRDFFGRFFRQVKPDTAFAEPQGQTVLLAELCENPAALVNEFFMFAYSDAFPRTHDAMFKNLARISGLNPKELPAKPRYVWPKDSELGLVELNDAYLNGTPFKDILKLSVPFHIPERIRAEHTHVLAGSGAGKTTLLTQQFLTDVFDERQPALIVIDGKGTWAPALQRFACFAPDRKQSERLLIINPQDARPAALNMFALSEKSLIDGVSENLAYIFGSREFELSAKQRTAFTYAAQLIFATDSPSIETLLALMQDPVEKSGGVPASSRFREVIDRQPNINRRFFHELFYHPTEFLETKRQIQNRIYDLLSCPAFAAMFTQDENRLNMQDVMRSGKILIVDASPGAVGEKAASTFGRYIISLALSTARSRINEPRSSWRNCYLVIDEAQIFVDEERTQPLLQQAREFNLGVTLSHQKLDDLSPTLRATFAGNTSSKYCGHPSADDARNMAKEMRTDADFIMSQQHRGAHAHFAAYVRGVTPRALSYRFPLGTMDDTPKMTEAQYRDLMARNRSIMSPRPVVHAPTVPAPVPPRTKPIAPEESDDITGSQY